MSLRAAQVRFYVDADILGLGKILGSLRNDVTYPGDPGAVIHKRQREPCPIASPDVLDTDWIPQVAARGWLIITRDSPRLPRKIAGSRQRHPASAGTASPGHDGGRAGLGLGAGQPRAITTSSRPPGAGVRTGGGPCAGRPA